ncbi:hypothetical protein D3C71_1499200 [compost metagenome]
MRKCVAVPDAELMPDHTCAGSFGSEPAAAAPKSSGAPVELALIVHSGVPVAAASAVAASGPP